MKPHNFSSGRLLSVFMAISIIVICQFSFTNIAYGQWTRKADEISKRAECNNVLYNNKLYVFSGFADNPIIEKTNEVYDIAANKWTAIAPFPAGKEVTHQGTVLVDDNVWVIGGRAVDSHGPASSNVIIYNITTDTWSNGPQLIDPSTGLPFPLGAGGYVLLGRTIHVFGGFGPTLCEDQSTLHLTIDVDKYMANRNDTKWENKLAPLPVPRNHLSYVVLAGKIYAFGGQFKHDCGALNQKYCHVYDPATNAWTQLHDLPAPRSHAEAATFAVDGKIFLVAGQGYNNVTQNTVYQFTPQANNGPGAWASLSAYKLPGSFLGLSSKLAGKSFIITNGALNSYANERKETYIASVTRSTARTLGFSSSCLSVQSGTGQKVTAHNLLYVIEDQTTYSLTSDSKWLSVTKNNSGKVNLNGTDIEVSVDTEGLAAGDYTGVITANGAATASKASFCVNLKITPSSGYVLSITSDGSGMVTKTPDRPAYEDSSIVTLTAQANTGWHFSGWSGDTVATINPLMITVNKNKAIKATFVRDVAAGLITNIKSTTAKSYQLGELQPGVTYYTDRDYNITTVPSALSKAPFIKTANDDKSLKTTAFLSFQLTKAATFYIAYDTRGTALPAWLKTWKKLTDKIGVNEPVISSFKLYSKDYPAGNVNLGANLASPAAGAMCQYIVIALAKEAPVALAKNAAVSHNSTNSFAVYNAGAAIQKNVYTAANVNKPVLYPNPVHSSLQVIFPDLYKGATAVSVVNMNGNVRNLSGSLFMSSGKILNVNIEPLLLKQGTYLLHITSAQGKTDIIRFIIQ